MITIYLFVQAVLFLLAVAGFFQVQRFLKTNRSISSAEGLDSFKRLARVNMYVALVYIVLAVPMILMSMYIGYAYGLYGIAVVLGTSVPQMIFGKFLKSAEDKSRG